MTFGDALKTLHAEADRRIVLCIVCLLLLALIGGSLAASAPLALKYLVDEISSLGQGATTASVESVLPYGFIYLLALGAGRLTTDARQFLSGLLDQRVQARITLRYFSHIMRLPISYLLGRKAGELHQGLNLACAGYQIILSHISNSLVPVIVELGAMVIILSSLQLPAIIILFIGASAVYATIFTIGARRMAKLAPLVSSACLNVYGQLNDGITHIETLRCCSAIPQIRESLSQSITIQENRWQEFNHFNANIALAASLTFIASMAACLFIAGTAVAQGTISTGSFILASVYTLQMVRPLEILGSAVRDFMRALGLLHPFLEVLKQPVESEEEKALDEKPLEIKMETSPPSLIFKNINFGYTNQRSILKDFNLHVSAGRTTAIVGRSGSGKSSLTRLLLRLYSPQSGQILLGENSIDSIPIAGLRNLIGIVPQDIALLHSTIAENIALGVPKATQCEIEAAAMAAQLHEFVQSLPLGYDTIVGERGLQLSGGERQRIAIARAILRRPLLYILDEPTSMLDSKTEFEIQSTLREVTSDQTTIIIAHRLSTIMNADNIVVLEDGQVKEQGSHNELLKKGGTYSKLWLMQAEGSMI